MEPLADEPEHSSILDAEEPETKYLERAEEMGWRTAQEALRAKGQQ